MARTDYDPDLTTSSRGAFVNAAVAAMIAHERATAEPAKKPVLAVAWT